jgi:hypothetical protein
VALSVFIVSIVVVAVAIAIPILWMDGIRSREPDAVVLFGAVLGGGIGAVGVGLFVFFMATNEVGGGVVMLGITSLFPVIAALISLRVVVRPTSGTARRLLLALAACLSVGGLPVVVVFLIGGLTAVLAAACYLAGLGQPRTLISKLDPRD